MLGLLFFLFGRQCVLGGSVCLLPCPSCDWRACARDPSFKIAHGCQAVEVALVALIVADVKIVAWLRGMSSLLSDCPSECRNCSRLD